MFNTVKSKLTKLSLSAAALVASTGAASAQEGLNAIFDEIEQEGQAVPQFITYGAYLVAIVMVVLALGDIKKYVDQPAQNPIRGGVVKLVIAATLFAFPFVTEQISGVFGTSDGAVNTSSFNFTPGTNQGG